MAGGTGQLSNLLIRNLRQLGILAGHIDGL
jgi:hypothetical protein